MESKYLFKRSSPIQLATYITFGVITVILVFVWMWLRSINPELAIVANIFMPVMITFGVLGTFLQIFVISKRYFVKLTKNSMHVYRGLIPKTFDYADIKKIRFSGEMLKTIDTGLYAPWPILLNIENSQEFLQDLSQRYRIAIGKDLIIIS